MKQVLVMAALLLAAPPVDDQDRVNSVQLQAHALRGEIFWVEGGTANAGFVIGPDAVLVIDAQRTPAEGRAQMALIARHTRRPVAGIILTHADPDHVGGLPAYPAAIDIIMQENARAQIDAAAADDHGGPLFGPMYKSLAAHHRPHRTVADVERTTIGGVPVELVHPAEAHSSGDLIVYLPRHRVVFAGDIVLTDQGRFPIIHIGGSSLGWIASMKAMLALDAEVIVPGHGPIEPRAKLEARLEDAVERRSAIKKLVEAGRTLAEIDALLPPEHANPRFPSFNRTTYEELVNGYPKQAPPWASLAEQP